MLGQVVASDVPEIAPENKELGEKLLSEEEEEAMGLADILEERSERGNLINISAIRTIVEHFKFDCKWVEPIEKELEKRNVKVFLR